MTFHPSRESAGVTPSHAGTQANEAYLRHLAHELRASLNTVVGWVELLRAREFAPDVARQAADIIMRHSHQQAWLIDCVIEAWRVSTGHLVLERAPLDPLAVVRTAVEAVSRAASARRVLIELGGNASDRRIDGDAARLRLLFVSLLMNAVHFAPAESVIELAVTAENGQVQVRIGHREGRPDPSVLPERREQYGAGLTLPRALAEAHGGSVVTGTGADEPLFVVTLPASTGPVPPVTGGPART
ncbi:MAG TPA: ATP-binding protein [Vicinamibacterales bacterium]